MAGRMRIDIAAVSRTGPRARNEDAHAWRDDGSHACMVVSDGAGGHGGGQVAARIAVDTVMEAFGRQPRSAVEGLRALVDEANRAVVRGQQASAEVADMRATVVLLAIDADARLARWAHVGDSRLYVLRDGRVHSRTRDHSLAQTLIDAGLADESLLHAPARGVLTASLGGAEAGEARVSAPLTLQAGDALLLCTDGLWERLDDAQLVRARDIAETAADWLGRIEAVADPSGDRDNATALAVIWNG